VSPSRALFVLAILAALLGAPSLVSAGEPLRTPDSAVVEASAPPSASSPATISLPSSTPAPSPASATVASPPAATEPAADGGPSLAAPSTDTSGPAAEPDEVAAPREAADPEPATWTAPAPAPSPRLLAHGEEESQAPHESPRSGTETPPAGDGSPASSSDNIPRSPQAVPAAREPEEVTTEGAAIRDAVPPEVIVSLAGVAALALLGTALLLGARRRPPVPDDPVIAAEIEHVMRTRTLRRARLRRSDDTAASVPGTETPTERTDGEPGRDA
jgi:hypothetical protein